LCGGSRVIERPSRRISPSVGLSKPASIMRVVVLPDPDGPSSVRNSPGGHVEREVADDEHAPVVALLDLLEADERGHAPGQGRIAGGNSSSTRRPAQW
jgi:hypothetical protein